MCVRPLTLLANTLHVEPLVLRSMLYEVTGAPLVMVGATQSSLISAFNNAVNARFVGMSGAPNVVTVLDEIDGEDNPAEFTDDTL